MLGLLATAASAQTKVTRYLRFDLTGTADVGMLTNGVILTGEGTVERQFNAGATVRPRTYSVQLPVVRWRWAEHAFRFVPLQSGRVELKLMGPYEPTSPGSSSIYQQEVLWDDFRPEGTTIGNPGFETLLGGAISRWSGQGVATTSPVAEGVRSLRTWHNATMTQSLTVTGGVPVTLRFAARAHVPAGFVEMARFTGNDTPAHRAARKFMRGINLGNFLEMSPGTGTQSYSDTDFNQIKQEGFDHVRIPVTWTFYSGAAPSYTLNSTVFTRLDPLVQMAVSRGLGVIIDWHHFDAFMLNPSANTNQFHAIWQQIAQRYANQPDNVAFELLNEPINAAYTLTMNRIYPETIRRVRLSNPNRTLFVGPGNANSIDSLNELILPNTDSNLVVTVHMYDPFYFTHQATTWTGNDTSTRGVIFPGPPSAPIQPASRATNLWVTGWFETYNSAPAEYNPGGPAAFVEKFRRAREWSDYFGRPVHVGEFGAYETSDNNSRVRFHESVIQAMESQGLGWAMWDWKAGFHYMRLGVPHPPGMREAVFPPIRLLSVTPARFEFDGAVAKTYVVERALAVEPASGWIPVLTQTLAAPKFEFADPAGAGSGAAYYRVGWIK